MYDLVIIGGGPAAIAAGVYAARKRLRTVFIAESIGGQSVVSQEVQNWIGMKSIPGSQLASLFEEHLRAYANSIVDIKIGGRVTGLTKEEKVFSIQTDSTSYQASSVLIATGSTRRKLNIPGADQFENKGVTYCASCDGPLFSGQNVAIIGGGNAGFETAAQLLAYCPSVTLIHRHEDFEKADPSTVSAVLAHPNMHTLTNSYPTEIHGNGFVQGLSVQNQVTGEKSELPVSGVFVEIGAVPSTDFLSTLVSRNENGYIVVNPKTQRSSCDGLWAAGDCSDGLYHQNNIAAGDGVRALEDIFYYLQSTKEALKKEVS